MNQFMDSNDTTDTKSSGLTESGNSLDCITRFLNRLINQSNRTNLSGRSITSMSSEASIKVSQAWSQCSLNRHQAQRYPMFLSKCTSEPQLRKDKRSYCTNLSVPYRVPLRDF
jgi:hypothetical protein